MTFPKQSFAKTSRRYSAVPSISIVSCNSHHVDVSWLLSWCLLLS